MKEGIMEEKYVLRNWPSRESRRPIRRGTLRDIVNKNYRR